MEFERFYMNRRTGHVVKGKISLRSRTVRINFVTYSVEEAYSIYKPISESDYKACVHTPKVSKVLSLLGHSHVSR